MYPTVRVLLVTDDFGGPGGSPHGGFLKWQDQDMPAAIEAHGREFHLGEFVQVLENTTWLGFNLEITKAHRSPAGSGGMNAAALKADRGADVIGFRFNQPFAVGRQVRSLANYDMVLFFPVDPGNPNAALAPEAEAISDFMEAGGGFFATGDHANLGAELAGLIPRVRSMRRWWGATVDPTASPKHRPRSVRSVTTPRVQAQTTLPTLKISQMTWPSPSSRVYITRGLRLLPEGIRR